MNSVRNICVSLLAGLLTFGGAGTVTAQDGLTLMQVEAGARQAGMGGAFVALNNAPNAAFYNPAGVTGVKDINASFGHNTYWENVRLETGYISTRLGARSYLHGGVRFAKIDNLEFRTAPTAQPTTFFDAHDVSFKAGLAWDLTDRVTAGVAAGWFIEKIEAWRGSAFNLDFGAQIQATEQLRLGASATNLGSDLNLTVTGRTGARPISLPATYRVGAAYRYDRYLGEVDFVVLDDEAHVQVGAEAKLHDVVTVRAGYMGNYDTRNITAGLSLKHRNLTIDYAVVPFTDNLGTAHMFNFTFEL